MQNDIFIRSVLSFFLILFWFSDKSYGDHKKVLQSVLILFLFIFNVLTNTIELQSSISLLYILFIILSLSLPKSDYEPSLNSYKYFFSSFSIVSLNFILICLPNFFNASHEATNFVGWFYTITLLVLFKIESIFTSHIKIAVFILSVLIPVLFLAGGFYSVWNKNIYFGIYQITLSSLALSGCLAKYYLWRKDA